MAFSAFGPYSTAAVQLIDGLVTKRLINAREKESMSGDKEFVLYDLADYRSAKSLRELGIAGAIQSGLKPTSSDTAGISGVCRIMSISRSNR